MAQENSFFILSSLITFLLVEWRQDAVVPADLEVDLLLHAFRDGALRDNNADPCLDGAQDASVRVEDTSCCCHHSVALVFILIIVKGTGAKGRIYLEFHTLISNKNSFDLQWDGVSYLTGMALGTALMLLCWFLERWSIVRVKVSKPLSWSMFWGWGGV